VIGDVLCVLAGWLRMPWGSVVFFMLIGKAVRYVFITVVTLQGLSWFS